MIRERNPEILQGALGKAVAQFSVLSVLVIFIIGATFFILYLKETK